VISSWHPVERLCHQLTNSIGFEHLAYGDERAETVHWEWALIFDTVAALDVLLFSLLKQVGSGGHTNPHGHPHFSFVGDQVEVRVRRVKERGTNLGVFAKPFEDSLPLARFLSLERTCPNGSKICDWAVPRRRAQK
jgi:hypothetical protein